MSGEAAEVLAAPNWLNELEKKRENRLKPKLGHEAGAGAPCLTCKDVCPGLDLHFWRKICKNCKCSKEDHDVPDDDIYGWAQFQLLGNKVNKTKTKLVLPGKKDEVELEWTPKGHKETIDRYLKSRPVESLPVKGSQAAQERKQLLQKQIPIHDIDPTLCHELTEHELGLMQDYIKNVREHNVGVGQVIEFALHRGNIHFGENANALLISSKLPNNLSSVELVKRQNENTTGVLSKQLNVLNINNHRMKDVNNEFYDTTTFDTNPEIEHFAGRNLPPSHSYGSTAENPTKQDLAAYPDFQQKLPMQKMFSDTSALNQQLSDASFVNKPNNYLQSNLPSYTADSLTINLEHQNPVNIGNIRDLAFSTYGPNFDINNKNNSTINKNLQAYEPVPHNVLEAESLPYKVNIGGITDISYDNLGNKNYDNSVDPLNNIKLNENFPGIVSKEILKSCHKCNKTFTDEEFAIFVERSSVFYHPDCFKCNGCNQSLADMVYFYDKETDNIYCGRDFAKIHGIPRCTACDELIFVKEYCLAENSTFHVKHFCCFECDLPLAGQNYVIEDLQPFCVPCFEKIKANKCQTCLKIIKPDEQGANLQGVHFHPTDVCFSCRICKKPLLGAKLLFRNQQLYCSHKCFETDQ